MLDATVAAAVLEWAEGHPALGGLPVRFEDMPRDGDAVMLAALAGEPYVKRYKSGGHVAEFPFAVYLRSHGADTASRLDAHRVLSDLAHSIEDRAAWPTEPDGFAWAAFEARTLPARISSAEAGYEDWQLTLALTYRKRG